MRDTASESGIQVTFSASKRKAWNELVGRCARCEKFAFHRELTEAQIEGRPAPVCQSCKRLIEAEMIDTLGEEHHLRPEAVTFLAKQFRAAVVAARSAATVGLTLPHVIERFVAQRGFCGLTGRPLATHESPTSARLDVIDPADGLRDGNVHWVCSTAKAMRGTMSLGQFGDWCAAVVVHSVRDDAGSKD